MQSDVILCHYFFQTASHTSGIALDIFLMKTLIIIWELRSFDLLVGGLMWSLDGNMSYGNIIFWNINLII